MRTKLVALAAAGALCGSAAFTLGSGPAAADPLGSAQAQAAALQKAVTALQVAAEVAAERYDAVEAQFGQVVTEHVLAERQLQAAQQASSAGADTFDNQVRALYQDGGQLGLLATVLNGQSPTDIMNRYQDVVSILDQTHTSAAATTTLVSSAAAVEQRLAALATQQTRLQVRAADAAAAVQSDLARAQAMLAEATATVRSIEAADEATAVASAGAQAAQSLAAAAAAAGVSYGNTTPPNAIAAAAIAAAKTRLGDPYVWGGSGPNVFDCSGLTQWSYAQAGVSLPRVAADQYNAGPHVALGELEPGDLLFWATDVSNPATIHHVAMYLGNGYMIAAPHTGTVVQIEPVYLDGYIGAIRPTAGLAPAPAPPIPPGAATSS